jgi:PEP-CTERM motif
MGVFKLLAGVAALALIAPAVANASTQVFSFDAPGQWSGVIRLSVNKSGVATFGDGVIDVAGFKPEHLSLITSSTPGIENPLGYRSNAGDDWFGVDQNVPIDTNGLLFTLGKGPPQPKQDALFPLYSDGAGGFQSGLFGYVGASRFYTYNQTTALTSGGLLTGVPEPATWATMMVGLGLLGGAMRLRRKPAVSLA